MEALKSFTWNEIEIPEKKELGHGGYAVVVRAIISRPSRKEVALKLITKSMCEVKRRNYKEESKAIAEEGNILSSCYQEHVKNAIEIYGIVRGELTPETAHQLPCPGISGETAIGLVLQYFDCFPLYDAAISRNRSLNTLEKLRILENIAQSLTDLHALGIIHGDLKPENILIPLPHKDTARLIDFGLSKLRPSLPETPFGESTMKLTSQIRGTLAYCAPEMLENRSSVSRSTDMYAFGMVAGQLFIGGDFNPTDISYLSDPRLQVPREVLDMIGACTSRQRETRKPAVDCVTTLGNIIVKICSGTFDVFLSHASRNKPFVRYVSHVLTSTLGLRVWFDESDMGHDLKESMKSGIRKSSCVVICLSKLFLTRPACQFEICQAFEYKKPILVLRLEDDLGPPNEFTDLCLNDSKLYIDLTDLAFRTEWKNSDGDIPGLLLKQLREQIEPFRRLFDDIASAPTTSKVRVPTGSSVGAKAAVIPPLPPPPSATLKATNPPPRPLKAPAPAPVKSPALPPSLPKQAPLVIPSPVVNSVIGVGHSWGSEGSQHESVFGQHTKFTWHGKRCSQCSCFLVQAKVSNKISHPFLLGLKACPMKLPDQWIPQYCLLLQKAIAKESNIQENALINYEEDYQYESLFPREKLLSWGFLNN